MMINAITVKMLVTFPRNLVQYCANAAPLAVIYSTAVALALFWLIRRVYFTKSTIIGEARRLGGNTAAIFTGIAVFATLVLNILPIMRTFPEIIRLVLLQKTYVEIIAFALILVLIFGASCSIESIARVHEFFLPVSGIVFFAFIIMLIPNFKTDNLFPVFGTGIMDILTKGISAMSIFTDILALNIMIPYTKELDNYRKAGTKAILTGGVCSLLIILSYTFCYAYPASKNFIIPVYQLERLVNLSDFFSRLESLFQFIWSISILLYISMYIWVLAAVFKETFYLPHKKPLIAPIVLFLSGTAFICETLSEIISFEEQITRWIYIPAFIIPMFIGIVSHETFKRKSNPKGNVRSMSRDGRQ